MLTLDESEAKDRAYNDLRRCLGLRRLTDIAGARDYVRTLLDLPTLRTEFGLGVMLTKRLDGLL